MSDVVIENKLEEGMTFKSVREAVEYLGYTPSKYSASNQCKLKHFCEYAINSNHTITITKKLNDVLPFRTSDYKYDIGQNLQGKLSSFSIINRYKKEVVENTGLRLRKTYVCQCENNHPQFDLDESQITNGTGCPYCCSRRLAPGKSLYDLRPDLLCYLDNPEDAKYYTEHSNKYIDCHCPKCFIPKSMLINNLSKHGFSCNVCSDGISYPNKFVRNVFDQLGYKYQIEQKFDWSNGRIYDEYFEQFNMIVENHGEQHYNPNKFGMSNLDVHAIDIEKHKLAINNGIEIYIELDCRKSDLDYIKNSIMKSDLPNILKFNQDDIDWNLCDYIASNSLIREVWDFWNTTNDYHATIEHFNLSYQTITNYIKRGVQIGVCNKLFSVENSISENKHFNRDRYNTRPVYCITDDIYFSCGGEASKYYSGKGLVYQGHSISRAAKQGKEYKGKRFKYITKEDYNNLKSLSLKDKKIIVIGDFLSK